MISKISSFNTFTSANVDSNNCNCYNMSYAPLVNKAKNNDVFFKAALDNPRNFSEAVSKAVLDLARRLESSTGEIVMPLRDPTPASSGIILKNMRLQVRSIGGSQYELKFAYGERDNGGFIPLGSGSRIDLAAQMRKVGFKEDLESTISQTSDNELLPRDPRDDRF